MQIQGTMSVSIRKLAATLAMAAVAAAAQGSVEGTVKDAATQQPIAGATVALLTNPEFLAMTDANGAFVLELPTALRPGARAAEPSLNGTRLSFEVAAGGSRVSAALYNVRGNLVRTLAEGRFSAGAYALEAAPADLPSGIYLLRARVGAQSRAFRLATAGRSVSAPARASAVAPRLAKAAAPGGVDYLIVSKTGYLKKNHEVMAYTDAQAVTLDASKPAVARMGVFTDSAFGMIDWARATIYSWDQTAVLATDSTSIGFNGSVASMKVTPMEGAAWMGWAYHVAALPNGTQPTVDLTPYEGGNLHLTVKGTAKSIGVMMGSPNQGAGNATLVDLATKGYLPDDAWHEITIPVSAFAGTLRLSDIFIYCGFVSPASSAETFDPAGTYIVDEIWFSPAQ